MLNCLAYSDIIFNILLYLEEIQNNENKTKNQVIDPNFDDISQEDLKRFSFEKELDRLKKTLSDIKVQESRFIKLLGFKQAKMSTITSHKNQPVGDIL